MQTRIAYRAAGLLLALLSTADGLSAADSPRRVDCSTLTGKVMVGYQGWFNCQGDGAGLGWKHWARQRKRPFAPGNVTVDLWPDVSEFDADERYATGFQHADGSHAEVFSSANRKTVLRHFRWMHDYGIDGAFVQRFATQLSNPALKENTDTVLSHVRLGAQQSGRVFAVMYDLSGLKAGQVDRVRTDWSRLRRESKITEDATYLHHNGKPLVAVWGVGFGGGRDYTLRECLQLVRWLKSDGCSVMLGVPSFWREGRRDAVNDPLLQEIVTRVDVVSPWTVGRYRTPEQARRHARTVWAPDLQWCRERKIDFLPTVFPGFSWHNVCNLCGRSCEPPTRHRITSTGRVDRSLFTDHGASCKSCIACPISSVSQEQDPQSSGEQLRNIGALTPLTHPTAWKQLRSM